MDNMTPAEIVAHNAYRGFGISDRDTTLDSSIVAIANSISGGDKIGYTEKYFYEETIYTQFLIFEAQHRFNYLDWIIEVGKREGLLQETPAPNDIVMAVYVMSHWVTGLRMGIAGLEQKEKPTYTDQLLSKRIDHYAKLMTDSMNSVEDVTELPTIDNARNHPFEIYVGEVGDNIISALLLDNPLLEALVRQAVSIIWKTRMNTAMKASQVIA